jgi:hypothetical protein
MAQETNQQRMERQINVAIHAGRQAHHTGNRTILTTGAGERSYLVLAKPDGTLTEAGEIYYRLTGEQAPDRLDYTAPVVRRGNTEYTRDRRGNLRPLRTLQADGEFTYTTLGSHYFARQRSEYIVHVPVVCEGEDGRYTREDHWPFGAVKIDRIMAMTGGRLTDREKLSRVKQTVLQELSKKTVNGRPLLAEISGERWFYNRQGQWEISELRTEPNPEGGRPKTSALLRRPMGRLRLAAAFVTHSEAVTLVLDA